MELQNYVVPDVGAEFRRIQAREGYPYRLPSHDGAIAAGLRCFIVGMPHLAAMICVLEAKVPDKTFAALLHMKFQGLRRVHCGWRRIDMKIEFVFHVFERRVSGGKTRLECLYPVVKPERLSELARIGKKFKGLAIAGNCR